MLQKWSDKFVENCKQWWKLWSSWLAILWGCIVTLFWNDPKLLGEITSVMPDEIRAYLSPLVLAFVAGLPILVRLIKQQKLIDAAKGAEERKDEV